MFSPLARRLILRQAGRLNPSGRQAGYALPLVLVVSLALVGGAAALAARSGSSGFGAAFQKQSWDARSIAQFGLTTLVSRLNKEQNRGLLATADTSDANYITTLWDPANTAQLNSRHSNPCAIGADNTRLNPVINDLYPGGNKAGWWYVTANGQVSTSDANAVGRFRLIDQASGGQFRMGNKQSLAKIPQPSGKTSAVLSVEAIAMTNGRDGARTVLEAELDITPKCCRVTLGSMDPTKDDVPKHGNNDYTSLYSPTNPFGGGQCDQRLNPYSFGLLLGADGDGGRISSTQNINVCNQDSSNVCIQPTAPLACVSPNPSTCITNNLPIQPIDTLLDRAPEYYPSLLTPPTPGYQAIESCTKKNGPPPGKGGDKGSVGDVVEDCPERTDFETAIVTDRVFKFQSNGKTYINGNAAPANLPDYCKYASVSTGGDGHLHCVINRLVTKDTIQFVTGYRQADNTYVPRPIRLYFAQSSASIPANNPNDKAVINQSGAAGVEHCVELTTDLVNQLSKCRGVGLPVKISQLSMFGCNPGSNYYGIACGEQRIRANGNPTSYGYFAYFPQGKIESGGGAIFTGVFWVNDIDANGNVTFNVPSSGVAEALELLGINPGIGDSCDGSVFGECRPFQPNWDFVARSVRSFSFRSS